MQLVHDDRLRWLLRAVAMLHEGGAEPVAGLVLPNASSFPDRFDGSPGAVQRLMGRVLGHAGLAHAAVDVQLVGKDGEAAQSCKSGGSCSAPVLDALTRRRVAPLDGGGYAVAVTAGEVGHATALTTGLVRAASAIFLFESGLDEEIDDRDREAFIDVCGALLGFGVLLSNGAHIAHQGCGGVTIQRATALPVEELVVVTAIACVMHDLSHRAARSELDAEPKRGFDEAWGWVEANDQLIELAKTSRDAIEADRYRFAEPKGFFGRLLSVGRMRTAGLEAGDAAVRARPIPRDVAKAERMAALRDLVDDALD